MKGKKFLVMAVLSIVLIFIGIFTYHQAKLHSMEKTVEHYLYEEKNYQPSDIERIDGKIGKLPLHSVHVIFNDEPYAKYIYKVEDGEVKQISAALTEEGEKHISRKDFYDGKVPLKHKERTF